VRAIKQFIAMFEPQARRYAGPVRGMILGRIQVSMTLEQAVGQELEWRQPEVLRRFYQLTQDGREIAMLRFESSCGSLATGQCGQTQWTFKRTGFLSPKISVREAGSEANLALFSPGWMGAGCVVFNSGRRYHLRHTNFWGTEWAFEAEDGTAAITLSGHQGFFKQGGAASVTQSAAGLPETPVMLLLIWYLRVLMNEDASAAAVVVACG